MLGEKFKPEDPHYKFTKFFENLKYSFYFIVQSFSSPRPYIDDYYEGLLEIDEDVMHDLYLEKDSLLQEWMQKIENKSSRDTRLEGKGKNCWSKGE